MAFIWKRWQLSSQFPLLKQREQSRPILQNSNLSGDCIKDWFLCHLTQSSHSKKATQLGSKATKIPRKEEAAIKPAGRLQDTQMHVARDLQRGIQ